MSVEDPSREPSSRAELFLMAERRREVKEAKSLMSKVRGRDERRMVDVRLSEDPGPPKPVHAGPDVLYMVEGALGGGLIENQVPLDAVSGGCGGLDGRSVRERLPGRSRVEGK